MYKKFRSKKKRKVSLLFLLFVFLLIIFLFNYVFINKIDKKNIIDDHYLNLFDISFDKTRMLLKLGLNYNTTNKVKNVFKENELGNKIVYIYNTHQTEEYADGGVYDASLLLKDKLESNGVDVIFETTNISDELKKENMSYKDSYKITRTLLGNVLNDNIALYLDIHRDSGVKNITTSNINGVDYAKLMFVIGGNHNDYKLNYKVADNLNNLIKEIDCDISRGLYVRKSSNYNQDLANNVLLIEIGGPYNNMEEISNSVNILADAITYYVGT